MRTSSKLLRICTKYLCFYKTVLKTSYIYETNFTRKEESLHATPVFILTQNP